MLVNQGGTLEGRFHEIIASGVYDYARLKVGDVLQARIAAKEDGALLVSLNTKRSGIVPAHDLRNVAEAMLPSLEVGDAIPVEVQRWGLRDADLIQVSLSRGLQNSDWLRAQDMLDSGQVLEAEVLDANSGGVLVGFGRLQGFVPNSHLGSLPPLLRKLPLQEAKEGLVGATVPVVVIEVNRRRRRLVLSKRAAERHERQKLLETLQPGEIRTGVVRNIVTFGAFVDLGGLDGLVHVSEIAHGRVEDPHEALQVGQEIEVYVLRVDRERERISLSRKRLLPDPWVATTSELQPGSRIQGRVTSVVDFGLFVDIGQGTEGLVHVSEIPDHYQRVGLPEPGAELNVTVLSIDQGERRISLSLLSSEPEEQAAPAAEESDAEPYPVMQPSVLLY